MILKRCFFFKSVELVHQLQTGGTLSEELVLQKDLISSFSNQFGISEIFFCSSQLVLTECEAPETFRRKLPPTSHQHGVEQITGFFVFFCMFG